MTAVKSECRECGGTGLYRGMAEPEGVAVVCLNCLGTGCYLVEYTPFAQRKPKHGIRTVRQSKGSTILSCGPTGHSVSYEEFQKKGFLWPTN